MTEGFVEKHTGRRLPTELFRQQLQRFAENGYRFPSGKQLYEGTQHEACDAFLSQLGTVPKIPQAKGAKRPVPIQDGYFEIPTGVGKTVLFLSFIHNYLEATKEQEPPPRVLLVAPTKKLVEQSLDQFAKFLPEIAPMMDEAIEENGNVESKSIDYGKAQIGPVYSRRKVHDKPITVTTYQSILADMKREPDKRIFKPEEFGLVVFDEAHALTGDQFQRTAKEFEDKAIRLAFTATPHYSEEKTLSRSFPHRYYHLTTAEAMRRKDLCDVRPVLVKTNYTIDRSKLEVKLRNGEQKYNQRQLEQLLNVATRNQAAVDTYLTYRDPDTGERLFGQQGLVFCAGVTHAMDVANQFSQALEDREKDDDTTRQRKAAARKWVRENGIQIAAHVDGTMNDKERDAIFKQHEEGKILILCSDQLIKEGYDCPQDSFVMNLADTLSVVAAKQRNGRSFRLDEADPYKFATNFDFVDEDKYAQDRHNFQLLPIFCSEILGDDWQFREPMKRPGTISRRNSQQLPEPVLEHSEFEVISNPERVRTITTERQQQRQQASIRAPEAKPGWLSGNVIRKQCGGSTTAHTARIKALREAKLAELQAGGLDEVAAQCEVEEKWGAWAASKNGQEAWHVSPEGLQELIRSGKIRTERAATAKPGWLSGSGIKKQYGGTAATHTARIEALREAKLAELQARGLDETAARQEVEEKWVAWASKSGQEDWYISPEGLQELIRSGKIRTERAATAKPGWLSGSGIKKQYGGSDTLHTARIEALREAKLAELKATGLDEAAARQEVEEKWVALASKRGREETWQVSLEGLQELIRSGKIRTEYATTAKPDWMSGNGIEQQYGGDVKAHTARIEALREAKLAELKATGLDEAAAPQEVEEKWVAWAHSKNGHEAWHVSPEGLQELIHSGKIRTERAATAKPGWLSGKGIQQQYVGGSTTYIARIVALREAKLTELQAGGLDEATARSEVEEKWVAWARPKNGREAWYISPEGLQELIRSGKMQARKNKTFDNVVAAGSDQDTHTANVESRRDSPRTP